MPLQSDVVLEQLLVARLLTRRLRVVRKRRDWQFAELADDCVNVRRVVRQELSPLEEVFELSRYERRQVVERRVWM